MSTVRELESKGITDRWEVWKTIRRRHKLPENKRWYAVWYLGEVRRQKARESSR